MADNTPIPLRAEDRERLEAARAWIKRHFASNADEHYVSLEAKLAVINTNLEQGWVGPDDVWELEALGIAFGDAVAQTLLLDWVTIDDEYGCDPGLHWPGTKIYIYPVSIILKRIEVGELVDIYQLFDAICSDITEMAASLSN